MTHRQRSLIAVIVYAFNNGDFAHGGNYYATDISTNGAGHEVHFRNKLTAEEIYLIDDKNNYIDSKTILFNGKNIDIELKWMGRLSHEELELTIVDGDRDFYGYDYANRRYTGRHKSYNEVMIQDPANNWQEYLYRIRR